MIKAVIFDLDGTLLDRDRSLAEFVETQYDRLAEHVQHIPKDLFIDRFIELDAKGYVWKDRVYQQLIKELGIKGIEWQTLLADYVANFKNHCIPFPDLGIMLQKLTQQSFRLGMITNGRGQFQMDNILALGIEGHLEEILISEWEGMAKPDAAIFHKALASLNVSAGEAVYIGDHPQNDIHAAKAVGMKAIWKKGEHWSCQEADGEIAGLNEVPGLVERLNAEQ